MTTTAAIYKWIQLSHGRTRYIEAGTGEPLLLLHISSIESGADDYLPSLSHLAPQFRVIVPDLIGWPPSDTAEGIDAFPFIVDFLREFQDALGIRKWHVAGVSMGGWIAGLFAYESPDRCDKVIIGGHPFTGATNRRMIDFKAEMITSDDGVRQWLENVTRGQDVDTVALIREKLAKIHEPGYTEAFVQIMRMMGSPANRERYAMIRRLPQMRLPVLILIGERDEAAMALKDEVMAAAVTGTLKIVPSGHRMHIEDPEVFAQAVGEHIDV